MRLIVYRSMKLYKQLTQKAADSAVPDVKEYTLWDHRVPGFGLRVRTSGARTYMYVYRSSCGKQRRFTIGPVTIFTVKEARDRARGLAQQIYGGCDPAEQKAEAHKTSVQELYSEYAITRAESFSKAHRIHVVGIFRHEIIPKIGHKPIGEVTRADIRKITDKKMATGKKSMANNIHRVISAFMSWCYYEAMILDSNPLTGMRLPHKHISRARFLTPNELATVWHLSEQLNIKWKVGIRLLMLTGQRSSEVFESRIEEFDLKKGIWNIPASRTKNRRLQTVYLNSAAINEIASIQKFKGQQYLLQSERTKQPRPVSGSSGGIRRIKKIVPFKDWCIHDLRRSVATHIASLEVPPHIIQVILNHSSGFRSGVTAIYNRYEYNKEAEKAWTLWGYTLTKWVNDNKTYLKEPSETDEAVL